MYAAVCGGVSVGDRISDIDKSLNEVIPDKIRKYRSDYDNHPPNSTSFMHAIDSTFDR